MKKTFKKNLTQIALHLDKKQVINQSMETAIKGGNVVIEDVLF